MLWQDKLKAKMLIQINISCGSALCSSKFSLDFTSCETSSGLRFKLKKRGGEGNALNKRMNLATDLFSFEQLPSLSVGLPCN